MTNYMYIVLPVVYGYVMQKFCPFVNPQVVQTRKKELSETVLNNIHDVVWPLLFLMVGFSWYFARDKAQIVQKIGKKLSKGSRSAVSVFGKIFGNTSQTTALDTAYGLFTLFLGWWMVTTSCTSNTRNAMLVLFLTSISGTGLLYLITSYGRGGLFALIPVVLWLFFANEYSIRDYMNEVNLPKVTVTLATPATPATLTTLATLATPATLATLATPTTLATPATTQSAK